MAQQGVQHSHDFPSLLNPVYLSHQWIRRARGYRFCIVSGRPSPASAHEYELSRFVEKIAKSKRDKILAPIWFTLESGRLNRLPRRPDLGDGVVNVCLGIDKLTVS